MSGGSYRGTAVPPVGGISYHGYTPPANWQDPAVTGKDLMVHRDVLREVASQISALAGELQGVISAWHGNAASAASSGAVGAWPEAQQLAEVIGRSHSGFGQYSGDLREAHSDTATRITISAERYDATEQANVSLATASHDPSAIIVESGGNNVPVDPGYGKNWTPQQREAYARTQRLININDGGEVWNGTFPISAAAGFQQANAAAYTWQEVQSLLAGTDPGAISAAGTAYGQLAGKLTEVASKVASLGNSLAGSWGGSTAVTAVSQVQQLYQTASDMQANAWQAQNALTWFGSVLGAFKANLPQPASSHPADVAAANQAAQQRMTALNGHIQTAYNAMPGAVNKNLPPKLASTGGGTPPPASPSPFTATAAAGSGGPSSSGAAPGGGGGGAGAGAGPGPGGTGSPPGAVGGFPPPGTAPLPGGGTPPGSQLAGSGPGGAPAPGAPGGPAPGGGAPGGTTPGGPAGGVVPPGPGGGAPGGDGVPPGEGTVPGGGAIPPGEGTVPGGTGVPPGEGTVPGGTGGPPGEGTVPGGRGIPGGGRLGSLPGEGSVPTGAGVAPGEPGGSVSGVPPAGGVPGEPGAAGEPGSSLAAEGEAGAGNAMEGGMFPMTGSPGGGAGAGGFDRARQSWITEDDGIWGADGGGLGGAGEAGDSFFMPVGAGGTGRGREQDRARQAWLAEDEDLWGAAEPAVPPVIGR